MQFTGEKDEKKKTHFALIFCVHSTVSCVILASQDAFKCVLLTDRTQTTQSAVQGCRTRRARRLFLCFLVLKET